MPSAQAGNQITTLGGIKVGGQYVNVTASMTVTANQGGVATFKVVADFTQDAQLAKYNIGIVYVEIVADDGSSMSTCLSSKNS